MTAAGHVARSARGRLGALSGERPSARVRRRPGQTLCGTDLAAAGNTTEPRASNRAPKSARRPVNPVAERRALAAWPMQVGWVTSVPNANRVCRLLILLIVDKTYQFKKLIKGVTAVTAVTGKHTGGLYEIQKVAWAQCPKPIEVRSVWASQTWSVLTIDRHSTSVATSPFYVPYMSYIFWRRDSGFGVPFNDYGYLAPCQRTGPRDTFKGVSYA